MKLDDIRYNLEKDIILYKKNKIINYTKEQVINSIDNLSDNKKDDINISWNKNISVKKLNKKQSIDWIKIDRFYNKNINLYKKILNSSSIFKLKNIRKKFGLRNHKNNIKNKNTIKNLHKEINYYKIWIFISIFILFSIFDKYYIEYLIKSWINNLWKIQYVKNLEDAKKNISDSRLDFTIAQYFFLPFSILPIDEIQNINNIIKIWKETTYLLDNTIITYLNANDYILNNWKNITWLLEQEKNNINNIWNNIHKIKSNIIKLNTDWKLKQYKDKLIFINKYITKIDLLLININNNFEDFLNILWKDKEKTYLIVFQNNDEIRATWWFMWSVWIIKIKNWNILNFEKKDIYALEWEINKNSNNKITPPKWIKEITSSFWLRDSNFFPEFKKSANSINFFMNKSKYNINWVIFINMLPILNLLEKNNWLYFNKIQKHIDWQNFAEVMSFLVEAKKYKKWTLWTPKQLLFDFIVELTDDLKKKKDYLTYFNILEKALINRELVIHLFNKDQNNIIKNIWLNWIINYDKYIDFNYPVYTSIWWNKTDRYIKRKYKKHITINKNCRIDSTIDIILQHDFTDIDKTRIKNMFIEYWIKFDQNLLNISWAGENISYLRFLIPKNAVFFQKEWQKLIKKDNYSIIELKTNTKSWERSNYNIAYYIENKDCKQYNYRFIKQPWLYPYDLELDINHKTIKESWIDWDYIYNKKN